MRRKLLLRAVTALAVSLPAFAQTGPGQGPGSNQAQSMMMPPGGPGGGHGPGGGFFGPPGMHNQKLVTSAPYSAVLSNTMVQHLADGNTVTRSTTGQVARDSQGRTYEQVTINGGPFAGTSGPKTMIFLSDPVAGLAYMLDSTTKTAVQRPFHARTDGTAMPPHHGASTHPQPPSAVESELPADSSSGVTADGKSITRTIPAGAMGNAQPIITVDQVWSSPDLQIVVKSIRKDPFFGESTYALTNIVTKEPDASLFKVPANYTISTAPGPHDRHGFADGPPPPEN